MADYDTIESFYSYMSPQGIGGGNRSANPGETDKKTIVQILMESLLTTSGVFMSYEGIKTRIDEYFKKVIESEKNEIRSYFRAMGPDGPLLDDKVYWESSSETTLTGKKTQNSPKKIAVFMTRSPYINPSTRGTGAVDFFLNYMPPIVASQIIPYLDVEFEMLTDSGDSNLSTPSTLQFLLGSKKTSDLNQYDTAIEKSSFDSVNNKSFSGMEMFLAPQMLSNMDDMGHPVGIRNSLVKPFLPFASIEGLEIQTMNAGAGAFVHKKGTLRLKIHDKARLPEISQFIRGSSGFNEAIVWTTSGWLAPRVSADENPYAAFINDNMLVRECWQPSNAQFSFDAAGQVSLSIELQSKGMKFLQEIKVGENGSLAGTIRDFNALINEISRLKDKIYSNSRFSADVMTSQIINAAATTGDVGNIKDADEAINNISKSLKSSGLNSDELKSFGEKLKELKKDKTGKTAYERKKDAVGNNVKNMFKALLSADRTDPFLPTDNRRSLFVSEDQPSDAISDLIRQIKKNGTDKAELRAKIVKESAAASAAAAKNKTKVAPPPISIPSLELETKQTTVASFGKIFLDFVAPNVKICDELQIIFYCLNDRCGPVSGLSIAEFPIDVQRLVYEYNDALFATGNDALSLEQFVTLIANTQFSSPAAIGYGMNSFYKPFEYGKSSGDEQNDDKNRITGMAAWSEKYGSLSPASIEVYVESGKISDDPKKAATPANVISTLKKGSLKFQSDYNSSTINKEKTITRIHIYDTKHNPYSFIDKIVDSGKGYEVGEFDEGSIKNAMKTILNNKAHEQLTAIKKDAKNGNEVVSATLEIKKTNIGINVVKIDTIGNNPQDIKAHLKRFVPNITLGTNGTMVLTANVASKTDSLQGAINIIRSADDHKTTLGPNNNGLQDSRGIPLLSVPMQVTMTTMGVPIAQLYQTYFLDFNTGTTIDNLYNCVQLNHSYAPGKFTTNWTFAYTQGYARFMAPPSVSSTINGALADAIEQNTKKSH